MKRIFTACCILACCAQAFAAASLNSTSHKRMYFGAGVGDFFSRVEGDNYLNTGTGWPDDHYSNTGGSDQPLAYVAGGYTWDRSSNWLPSYSLGLRLMYMPSITMSGVVDQYTLPGFRNYTYTYDVSLMNLLGVAKIDLYRWRSIMPYIMLGAGVTSYSSTNYQEQATAGVTPRVNPGFDGGSGNNFAYLYGAGFDFAVRENLWVNLEFNYSNYGTVNSGPGANYATLTGTNYDNESLSNKLAGTAVLLGLTFYPA